MPSIPSSLFVFQLRPLYYSLFNLPLPTKLSNWHIPSSVPSCKHSLVLHAGQSSSLRKYMMGLESSWLRRRSNFCQDTMSQSKHDLVFIHTPKDYLICFLKSMKFTKSMRKKSLVTLLTEYKENESHHFKWYLVSNINKQKTSFSLF